MKIFITGISGFIGYHLARKLFSQGHHVLGIDSYNSYYDVALKRARSGKLDELGIENSYGDLTVLAFKSDWFNKLDYMTEISSIGYLLYTDYTIQFLLSGNILLLATIGPVTLVLVRSIETSKTQIVFKQLSRTYSSVLSI